jgi:hypothetical protein
MQSNQAGIAAEQQLTIAVAYENEFLNPELSRQSAVIVYPHKNNAFGLSIQDYGFSAYSEQRIAFAYARNFGNAVFAAINFNFHQLKISQYGSAETYSVEIGLQYPVNEKLLLGAHIANPNRSNFSSHVNAAIPVSIEFGVAYSSTKNTLFSTEIIKTLNSTTDVRTGIEYTIGRMAARGGFSVNPFRQYAGFGFSYAGFQIDAAISSHLALGYSPQLSLSYEF